MLDGLEQASGRTDYANDQQVGALTGQFQGLHGLLGSHIEDEDELIFPVLDQRAKHVVPNYNADHVGDREHLHKLNGLIMGLPKTPAAQRAAVGKQVYREAVAVHATGSLHMEKEEQILYPLFNAHTSDDEQWAILKKVYEKIPVEMIPMAAPGLMGMLNQEEREEELRSFMKAMPPASFKVLVEHAPKGMSPAEWQELRKRIPALTKV